MGARDRLQGEMRTAGEMENGGRQEGEKQQTPTKGLPVSEQEGRTQNGQVGKSGRDNARAATTDRADKEPIRGQ